MNAAGDIAESLLDMPALTLAGMLVKLRVNERWTFDEGELLESPTADIKTMAGARHERTWQRNTARRDTPAIPCRPIRTAGQRADHLDAEMNRFRGAIFAFQPSDIGRARREIDDPSGYLERS